MSSAVPSTVPSTMASSVTELEHSVVMSTMMSTVMPTVAVLTVRVNNKSGLLPEVLWRLPIILRLLQERKKVKNKAPGQRKHYGAKPSMGGGQQGQKCLKRKKSNHRRRKLQEDLGIET